MPNRVQERITQAKQAIQSKLDAGAITASLLEECSNDPATQLTLTEYCDFQELKTLAVANNVITLEEGQFVYRLLGESLSTFHKQDLPTRIVLMKFYAQLIQLRQANVL